MAYIYKITNKINNKVYIGETTTTLVKDGVTIQEKVLIMDTDIIIQFTLQ